MMGKQRLYGLDILRIVAALMVCAFHTQIHLGADYGPFTTFVSQGAIFMTLFFMLSGYSLFTGYADKPFGDKNNFVAFFKKRFIGIVPMYWIAGLLYNPSKVVTGRGGYSLTRDCAISNRIPGAPIYF